MKFKELSKIDLIEMKQIGIYRVRIYPNRIAICRNDKISMTWSEAQNVKEKLYPQSYFIEIYPPEVDVVNKYPTKHLWKIDDKDCLFFNKYTHKEFTDK